MQLKQVARNNIFISHTYNHTIPIIRPWFDSKQRQGLFSCPSTEKLWGNSALSPGVKAAKWWRWSFTQLRADGMNVCIYPSNFPWLFVMSQATWDLDELSGGRIWLIPNPRSNGCDCHFHAPTILSHRTGWGSSTYWKGAMSIPNLTWTWCCRGKSVHFYNQTLISQSIASYFIKWVNHSPQGFATEYLKTVKIKVYVWRYYYLPDVCGVSQK